MCCLKSQVVQANDTFKTYNNFLTYFREPCQMATPAPTTPEESLLEQFLNSGDITSEASTIGYTFKPISEVLAEMGLHSEGRILAKAIEYHNCFGPNRAWMQTENSNEFSCQCTLECDSGEHLDVTSCTCIDVGADSFVVIP